MKEFEIDRYVENVAANKNIRSFYPIAVYKSLHIPLRDIIDRLDELVKVGYLELKFEIRCDKDLDILTIVDDYGNYLQTQMYCEECDDYIEITLNNIFPVYYIKPEYREYIKKNIQCFQIASISEENNLSVNENISSIPIPQLMEQYINEGNINKKIHYLKNKDCLTLIFENVDNMNIISNGTSDVSESKIEKSYNDAGKKFIKCVFKIGSSLKSILEFKELIDNQFPGIRQYFECIFNKFIS